MEDTKKRKKEKSTLSVGMCRAGRGFPTRLKSFIVTRGSKVILPNINFTSQPNNNNNNIHDDSHTFLENKQKSKNKERLFGREKDKR